MFPSYLSAINVRKGKRIENQYPQTNHGQLCRFLSQHIGSNHNCLRKQFNKQQNDFCDNWSQLLFHLHQTNHPPSDDSAISSHRPSSAGVTPSIIQNQPNAPTPVVQISRKYNYSRSTNPLKGNFLVKQLKPVLQPLQFQTNLVYLTKQLPTRSRCVKLL